MDDVWQLFLNTPEASMSILENQGPLQLECEASAHADLQIPQKLDEQIRKRL